MNSQPVGSSKPVSQLSQTLTILFHFWDAALVLSVVIYAFSTLPSQPPTPNHPILTALFAYATIGLVIRPKPISLFTAISLLLLAPVTFLQPLTSVFNFDSATRLGLVFLAISTLAFLFIKSQPHSS